MQGARELGTGSEEENHFPTALIPGDRLELIFYHLLDEMNILPTTMQYRHSQHKDQFSPLAREFLALP